MDFFSVNSEQTLELLTRLVSRPGFVLKVISTFKDPNPAYALIFVCILLTTYCYVRDRTGSSASFVDKVWSVAPIIYSLVALFHYSFHHPSAPVHQRLTLCAVLITLWGLRLTYNLYIKGGYKRDFEDYRWSHIRTWFTGRPWTWFFFELFVINVYQMVTIFLFSVLPLYTVYYSPAGLQMATDVPLAALFLFFLLMETVADRQMFAFQTKKRQKILDRDYCQFRDYEVRDGFMASGLYKYSRHPNYFAELSQWWTMYFLASMGVNVPLNWTIIGALNLTILVYRGMLLSEGLTSFKYPTYKIYARRTSRLIPWFPGKKKKKT